MNLPSLTSLSFEQNKIKSLESDSLSQLTSLESINLNNNQLSSFTLDDIPSHSLHYLALSSNNLQSFTTSKTSSLKQLKLNSNNLGISNSETAFKFLSYLPELNELDISKNRIQRLTLDIPEKNDEIFYINAESNQIRYLHKSDFGANFKYVTELNLKNNQLQGIEDNTFQNISPKTKIHLKDNKWSCCHSAYLYSWKTERDAKNKFVVSNPLQCVNSYDFIVDMTPETVSENCFENVEDHISYEYQASNQFVFHLVQTEEIPPYASWEIDVNDRFFSLSKSKSYQWIPADGPGTYNICFQYSETENRVCSEFVVPFATTPVYDFEIVTNESLAPADNSAILYGVLAGGFLMTLFVTACAFICKAKNRRESFNKEPSDSKTSFGGFINSKRNAWESSPLRANIQSDTIVTSIPSYTNKKSVDARNEFDVTVVRGANLIKPPGYATIVYPSNRKMSSNSIHMGYTTDRYRKCFDGNVRLGGSCVSGQNDTGICSGDSQISPNLKASSNSDGLSDKSYV